LGGQGEWESAKKILREDQEKGGTSDREETIETKETTTRAGNTGLCRSNCFCGDKGKFKVRRQRKSGVKILKTAGTPPPYQRKTTEKREV